MTTKQTSARKAPAKKAAAKTAPALPVVHPTEDDPAPLDDAAGYDLGDKQVVLGQLCTEIKNASNVENVNLALSGSVLWVEPANIDPALLAQVVADHQPDPSWGIPNTTREFMAAVQRLRADPGASLSDDDRDVLLKGLALNYGSLMFPEG